MQHVVVGLLTRKRRDGETQYLLVRTDKDYGEFTGFWYPAGGHMEEGEDEKTTLIREIKEELGIVVKPLEKIVELPGDAKDHIASYWSCEAQTEKMDVDTNEIAGIGWFTKEEIRAMRIWPATKRFFEEYIFSAIGK
jgi:8-oxo-dGTP pyrophosphatase MutT (NUDIX family)